MDVGDKDSLSDYRSKSSGSSYYFLDDDELEYMGLIQDQIQPFFPGFAAAIAKQSPIEREQGRCAVIDLTISSSPYTTKFANSAELESYLRQNSSQDTTNGSPKRRLFILEDLPCNHVLAIGSRLRIPPSFFAGHWEDPATSTFNHRNPFERCTKSQFRLRYGTSNRVEVDAPSHASDNIYAFNANVSRYLHVYNPNGLLYDEPRSHHNLSFWSSPSRDDGSWDAILLVDPMPGDYVRCMPSRQLVPLRHVLRDDYSMPKHFLYPEIDALHELSQDSSQWANAYKSPKYKSMFDDTIDMFAFSDREVIDASDPRNATEFPRRLVISTITSFLRRRYMNLVTIQKSRFRPQHMLRHNYLASFSEGSFSSWNDEFFDFIVGTCAAMREFSREMEENIIALGLDKRDSVTARAAPKWEIDGWRSIRELTRVVDEMTNAFATGYLQYVTIQEAHVSNSNAQSLSRITVLTMLFIPLSTVASIFSMGGDFLPGETRAWVFWVVAIPVLVLLAYLYWHQQVIRMWQRRKQSILPLFEIVGKKT